MNHAASFLERLVAKRWPNAEVRIERHSWDNLFVVTASFSERDIRTQDHDALARKLADTMLPKAAPDRRRHPSRYWRKRR
jgi:hypothetical protein